MRRHPRIGIVPTVVTGTVEDGEPQPLRNMSLGGIFLCTRQRWPVGSEVTVSIDDGKHSLTTRCRVTHLHSDGVGFSFVNADDGLLLGVENMIDRLLSAGASQDGRRRCERELAAAAIVVKNASGFATAQLQDISQGGARVRSSERPELGSEIYVYLPAYTYAQGSAYPSELRGCAAKVVHFRHKSFGIEFQSPSAEFLMAVSAIVSQAQDGEPAEGRTESS
ncbi:MAG: PilZ domain-containing protein [Myxococcota bacterium]